MDLSKNENKLGLRAHDHLALDLKSARSYDADGRLHVAVTNISKANVCQYLGSEIPDWQSLGLEPNKLYRLYRHPDELAKAAKTFNNIPILSSHVPVSAADHSPDKVVGSTGTDAEFSAPYLRNSLVIWAQDPIDAVRSGMQRELSCGYRYTPDMTPGVYKGEAYDGIMREIVANHVALVKEGRAGPDVVIGDSIPIKPKIIRRIKMPRLSRKAVFARGALESFIGPKLAADEKVNLTPLFKGVTTLNYEHRKDELASDIMDNIHSRLAEDEKIGVIEIMDILDAFADPKPSEAPIVKDEGLEPRGSKGTKSVVSDKRKFLMDKLSAEDMKAYDAFDEHEAMDGDDDDDDDKKDKKDCAPKKFGKDKWPVKGAHDAQGPGDPIYKDTEKMSDDRLITGDMVTKQAMNEAIADSVKVAQDAMRQSMRDIREAEEAVRPYIGKLAIAHDSAESIYRTALTSLGVKDVDKVHESALKVILQNIPVPGAMPKTNLAHPTMDAANTNSFFELFPEAKENRVRTL